MSGLAPFAPARELASYSVSYKQAWAAAAESWAMDNDCEAIDTENTSEFFRVWLSCVMYGVCLITAISVPYYLCSNRPDKEFESSDQELPEGVLDDGRAGSKPPPPTFELDEAGEDSTPNIAKAKAHYKTTMPLDHQGNVRSVFRSNMRDISEVGGIGIELYFRLLRSMGLCFAYLTVFSLPSLLFSNHGNFVPDSGSTAFLAKLSIGNLGQMASAGVSQVDRLVIVGCQGMPLAEITKYFGWLDFFGVVFYMLFVAWYNFKFIPEAAQKNDDDNITCADFAVEVSRLPPRIADHENYEAALAQHILGVLADARQKDRHKKTVSEPKVCEVALVRDFGQRMETIQKQAERNKKLEIQKAYGKEPSSKKFILCGKKTLLQEKIDKANEKLAQKVESENELKVLRAYVLLNSADDRGRLLNEYRFANYALGRMCQSQKLRFNGKAIRMKLAPEPTNILWVNQDVPWQKRLFAKSVMIAIWLVVMLASTGLILAAQTVAKSQGPKTGAQVMGEPACDASVKIPESGYLCNTQIAMNWTIADARANFTNRVDDMNCFCATKGYKTVLENVELRDDLCKSWAVDAAKTAGFGAAASIITVVINLVLQALIKVFAEKEKHTSVSSRSGSLMIKVCISQIVNTGIIIALVNYNGLFFGGDYTDFERGWYSVVGSALSLNLGLNCIVPAGMKIVMALVSVVKRFPCFTKKLKHQDELLKVYENPPFDLSIRYAQILTTSFLTLMYSPGLPVLNFFAVIYCTVNFWVDKWILLRFSKRPPLYDTKMPKDCTSAMLFAGPLHILLSIAMYSHPCTIPSKPLGGSLASMADKAQGMASAHTNSTGAQTVNWTERVALECTWMSFVALCMFFAFFGLLIVKVIIGGTFGSIVAACRTACCPKRVPTLPSASTGEDGEDKEPTWDRCWRYIEKTRPPASYRMDQNPEYMPLVRFMRTNLDSSRGLTPTGGKTPLQSASPGPGEVEPQSPSVQRPEADAEPAPPAVEEDLTVENATPSGPRPEVQAEPAQPIVENDLELENSSA
jgi:hypothetical protein